MRVGFTLRGEWHCSRCAGIEVGQTVWFCDLCSHDVCSACMGFGADPFGHTALAQSRALAEARSAADAAFRAESEATRLAPPDLRESAPFRERALHVTNEWCKREFPLIEELDVRGAKMTPNRNHIARTIMCKSAPRHRPVETHDWMQVLYSPARQHESPSSQRRRIMRFRRREEQALKCMHDFFQSLEQSDLDSKCGD